MGRPMTAPTLGAREIVASAICQQIIRERDEAQDAARRYRAALAELRADHADNGSRFCTGDHAAIFVPFPCEVHDACSEALQPGSTS
jgi:hypothetical protein